MVIDYDALCDSLDISFDALTRGNNSYAREHKKLYKKYGKNLTKLKDLAICMSLPSDEQIAIENSTSSILSISLGTVPPKRPKKNLLLCLKSKNSNFQSPSNGAFSLLVTSLRQSFQCRKRTCKG